MLASWYLAFTHPTETAQMGLHGLLWLRYSWNRSFDAGRINNFKQWIWGFFFPCWTRSLCLDTNLKHQNDMICIFFFFSPIKLRSGMLNMFLHTLNGQNHRIHETKLRFERDNSHENLLLLETNISNNTRKVRNNDEHINYNWCTFS